jgi:hypothetical protein
MFRCTILLVCVLAPLVMSKSIARTTCGPVCLIYCQDGNVLDENGCPTCRCKRSPCKNGQAPLKDYFCGRGPNRQDCPSTHECIIAPNDAYAVCCRRDKEAVTKPVKTTEKPGSCPPRPEIMHICTTDCANDNNCQGDLKCCGNCPRACVKPVF